MIDTGPFRDQGSKEHMLGSCTPALIKTRWLLLTKPGLQFEGGLCKPQTTAVWNYSDMLALKSLATWLICDETYWTLVLKYDREFTRPGRFLRVEGVMTNRRFTRPSTLLETGVDRRVENLRVPHAKHVTSS